MRFPNNRVVGGGGGGFNRVRLYALFQTAGQSLSQTCFGMEESPGSTETRRWITSTRRKPRESATESIPPPTCSGVRVKGWGKSPPGLRRRGPHGKPRLEQDRIGGVYGPSLARASGASHQARGNTRRRGMAAEPARGNRTRLTGRLDFTLASAKPQDFSLPAAKSPCVEKQHKF